MQPPYQPSRNKPAAGDAGFAYADPNNATTLPPQTQRTIGDALDANGVAWAWYAGAWNAAVKDGTRAPSKKREVIYAPETAGVDHFTVRPTRRRGSHAVRHGIHSAADHAPLRSRTAAGDCPTRCRSRLAWRASDGRSYLRARSALTAARSHRSLSDAKQSRRRLVVLHGRRRAGRCLGRRVGRLGAHHVHVEYQQRIGRDFLLRSRPVGEFRRYEQLPFCARLHQHQGLL